MGMGKPYVGEHSKTFMGFDKSVSRAKSVLANQSFYGNQPCHLSEENNVCGIDHHHHETRTYV